MYAKPVKKKLKKKKWVTNSRWSTPNKKRARKAKTFLKDAEISGPKKRRRKKKPPIELIPRPTILTTTGISLSQPTEASTIISLSLLKFKEGIMNAILQSLNFRKSKFKGFIPAFPDSFFLPVFWKLRTRKCRNFFKIQSYKISMQGKFYLFTQHILISLFFCFETFFENFYI